MKQLNERIWALALLLLAMMPVMVSAQDFTNKDTLRYVDAMEFRLRCFGKST